MCLIVLQVLMLVYVRTTMPYKDPKEGMFAEEDWAEIVFRALNLSYVVVVCVMHLVWLMAPTPHVVSSCLVCACSESYPSRLLMCA